MRVSPAPGRAARGAPGGVDAGRSFGEGGVAGDMRRGRSPRYITRSVVTEPRYSMTVGRSAALGEVFEPKSIAVIGASNKPDTVGQSLFRNILQAGYKGVAYPVNPGWKSVSGVRCYPTVADLPEVPDLGVVIVPAAVVPGVVGQLGKLGTKGVVIISSGFREIGGEGIQREEDLVRVAAKYRMS